MEDIALPIISLVVPTDEDPDASDKSDDEKIGTEFGKPTRRRRHPSDLKTRSEESSSSLSTFVPHGV
jgi:hypothetical protein